MRIGINLLYLIPGVVGGTETYAAGLLKGFAQVDKQNEFFVFVNRESGNWPIPQARNFIRVICPVEAINRGKRYFFEQFRLPIMLKKYKVDVVHSLGYVGPLRTHCPAVVTVHDLNYRHIGHTMPMFRRIILKRISINAANRADAVITVSEFSKREICVAEKIHSDKVIVTREGPRWERKSEAKTDSIKVQEVYGIPGPYMAAFGGGAVHKNISRLIKAFGQLRGRFPYQLVLIGHLPADIHREELPEGVVVTGYVPEKHVLPLLTGAEIFVLPSLYEGFGLPVLEAQQSGVPVVCSSAGSLPEVAGEGALYFDPLSIADMVEKISKVASDRDLQETLRRKGQINVGRFSWEQTAQKTLEVYEQVWQTRHQA